MKSLKLALLGLMTVSSAAFSSSAATPSSVEGSANGAPATAKAEPKRTTQKTTDVSFEDVLVQGKYHFSDEAVTTVEDDKVLDALLGVRTDFKDRLKKSSARH